jgi:S1-C subfamily serine protease
MDRKALRLATNVAAGMLSGLAVLSPAGAASAGTPADLSQQQIAAIAEAATVYISGAWSGYVHVPADGGGQWVGPLEADFSCSGFVASSDGYIVTAGHCADPAEGKKALVDALLAQAVQAGNLTEADAQQLIAQGVEDDWAVEGRQSGSLPVLTSTVYPATAIAGSGNYRGYDAEVVEDRPLAQGDVALLKVDPPVPLPVLRVADVQPSPGDTVDAVGYPGNVNQLVTTSVQPTFAKGQVSGRQQTDAGPFTQVGVSMSPGMSGGPVVNGQGDVIGTVSWGPAGDTQQLNFASTEDNVQALLARNGVKNELTRLDAAYRKGLAEFFAGRFHAAAQDLTTVLNSDPTQAMAQEYKAKAIANFPNEKPAAPTSTGGALLQRILARAIGAAVGGALVGTLIALVRRRRHRGKAEVALTETSPGGEQCPHCGSEQSAGARFCAGCGGEMRRDPEAVPAG